MYSLVVLPVMRASVEEFREKFRSNTIWEKPMIAAAETFGRVTNSTAKAIPMTILLPFTFNQMPLGGIPLPSPSRTEGVFKVFG